MADIDLLMIGGGGESEAEEMDFTVCKLKTDEDVITA